MTCDEKGALARRLLTTYLSYKFHKAAGLHAKVAFPFMKGRFAMLGWAITFLIVALIAGLFGFGLVGGMAFTAAKICFFVFLVLFIVSLIFPRIRSSV
jgi:uncharacterized membrane protein YtjA (UPF0391 family)